ncbi:DNA (cytosine-5-)-methyltransferase [bacterium D16-34]|nr:DNA (cytosine-5-)-methyltransferase [bacterium D16-34]
MPVVIGNKLEEIANTYDFNFIDLCAGIGGFHQAMSKLGGRCVGASEIDAMCMETYQKNFNDVPMLGDLTEINDVEDIEDFQVICAGFPCQPFSKAGKQQGFADEKRGKLFFKIMDILDNHPEVEFILMENVRNLSDRKDYWETIVKELKDRDFVITEDPLILSPSDFGVPQIRERVFILGIKKDLKNENLLPNSKITEDDLDLEKKKCDAEAALGILEDDVDSSYCITEDREEALLAWDEFRAGTNIRVIGFPIWISHFGVGEDSDKKHFEKMGLDDMPKWKQNFLKKNRHFYQLHREFIDPWIEKYHMLDRIKLLQKFEWNCGEDVADIKHGLIQIRQSGVRVKRPNFFPALVAMPNTPIVWDKKMEHFREITPREAARLQSFDEEFEFTGSNNQTYKQLGNAINVEIAKQLGQGLFRLRRRDDA